MLEFLALSIYFLVLINPVSKIFILSALSSQVKKNEIYRICIESSLIALGILFVFAVAGHVLLTYVFHVQIYAFRIAGGIVVFAVGYKALTKGLFYEVAEKRKLVEMSVISIASPMIAGPGTITAAVTAVSENGMLFSLNALFAAVMVNLVLMLLTPWIIKPLSKYNITGALIRITGLIVMTIGAQLVLDGSSTWISALRR